MPNFGEVPPKLEDTGNVEEMKKEMGMPDVADDALNKLDAEEDMENDENMEMSEKEKLALKWIEENKIKEGVKLDWNGMDTLVTEVDFSGKVFSYEITEAGHEEKKTVTFEKLGEGINFLNNFTKVKESE